MFKGSFVFGLIGALLLIGLMAGGGYMAYQAGFAQGTAQAPEIAQAISQAAESGQGAPIQPLYGYGYGPRGLWGYPHHIGFFPLGGILGGLFFLFLFFGLLRMIFFRPWHMGWGHYGPWRGSQGGPWGGPPWMKQEGEQKEESPEEKK
jgi:hypothetical protein